jgi:hypothetical protein
MALVGEGPRNLFAGEAGKRKDDVRVTVDESPVEIGKSKEGLNVLNFSGLRPILNDFDLGLVHSQTVQRKDKS